MKATNIDSFKKCKINYSMLSKMRVMINEILTESKQVRALESFRKEHTAKWHLAEPLAYVFWLREKFLSTILTHPKQVDENRRREAAALIVALDLSLIKGRDR